MKRLIKQRPETVRNHQNEDFVVLGVNEPVGKDAETLVNPQPGHGLLGIVEILVGAKQSLEDLDRIQE